MKKFLSLLALTLTALSSWGFTVTFTPSTVHGSVGASELNTMYNEGVIIQSTSAGFSLSDQYRFYAYSTTTFTSLVGRITKVVITCTGSAGNSHAPNLFSGEGYTYSGYQGTWTGLAESFSLYASAQVRVTRIVVTIEDPVGGEVATPAFYPNGGIFTDSIKVNLFSPPQGATIHYIEGSNENDFDWSTETIYTGPFYVSETKTLTAWATLNDQQSEYVTATFTQVAHDVPVPEFSPGSTMFANSMNVTISCADSTAVIYYSYDGEEWLEYTDGIVVDSDVTLFAKAVVDDAFFGLVESEVATATYINAEGGDGYPIAFNYYNDNGFTEGAPYTITRPGVAFTVTKGSINCSYRIYKNEKIIFTATEGNIKKIKFVCVSSGSNEYGPDCLTLDEGQDGNYYTSSGLNYYSYSNDGIWIGNSPQVSFTASLSQVRCTSIIVYLDTEPTGLMVATPVIAPDVDTIYVYRQEVTISCETPDATIYYSTDNENWNEYTGPFDVTETCTVYAYAELDGMFSPVSICKFKMAPEVENIAEANALSKNTRFGFNGQVIVTYQNQGNTWIKDDTGYGLMYDENVPEFPQGAVLKGGWDAEREVFYSIPEYQDVHNVEATGEVVTVTPTEYTTVTTDNFNEYVLLKNQVLNSTMYAGTWVNENRLAFYDRFDNIELNIEDGKAYDVVGIVGYHYKALEIYVISATEVVEEPEWQLGDVNHDNFVDVDDVTLLIAHILGTSPQGFFPSEANVNQDDQGLIDVDDVSALISKILGIS